MQKHFKKIPVTIISTRTGEARYLMVLLLITASLLVIGIASPLITLNKFILIENTFSIFSGTLELFNEGRFFLFFVISIFSILLPVLKIIVLARVLSLKPEQISNAGRYLHWMHIVGKWSMLDVFVVAVLVVTVKLGAVASVDTRFGLYAFTAAVLLTMYITARTVALTENRLENKHLDTTH